MSEKLQYVG
jgi:hypothetical protein